MRKAGEGKYLRDYASINNKDYKYTGDYYTFDIPIIKLRHMKIEYIMMAAAISAVYIAAGLIDVKANRIIYVMLPYAAMFLPIVFIISDVFRIAFGPAVMTRKQHDRSVLQLRRCSVALLVLAVMMFAGDLVFMITDAGLKSAGNERVFMGLAAALSLLAALLTGRQRNAVCSVVEQKEEESAANLQI